MPKDRSSLCIGFNSNYSMKIRQYVLFKIKNSPTRKLHWERNHSFYSENVWGSIEVRGLRFASWVMEAQNFFCPTLVKRRKDIFLYFFTELKTYHLFYSISKLFIFYITGSSEDVCSRSSAVISCRRLRQQGRLSIQFWWNF